MSRTGYSPKAFLQQLPINLIQEFFQRRNELRDILWFAQDEGKIDLIYDAFSQLSEPKRNQAETVFQAVHALACEPGIQTILKQGQFHHSDLGPDLAQQNGFYAKAMWTYLKHQAIFDVASRLQYADTLNRQYWVKWDRFPKRTPEHSSECKNRLATAISDYFKSKQGRGRRCTVEHYLRREHRHYYFAFPDDFVGTYLAHDNEGRLVCQEQEPTFEIVFLFDDEQGTLDLFAKGGSAVKEELVPLFCGAVLGDSTLKGHRVRYIYHLDPLLARGFCFAIDPEDGIEEVRLSSIRLTFEEERCRKVTVEADPKGPANDIYDAIDRHLNTQTGFTTAQVSQAILNFRFMTAYDKRPKNKKITLTAPGSSKKYAGFEEREQFVIERCLNRWGLLIG